MKEVLLSLKEESKKKMENFFSTMNREDYYSMKKIVEIWNTYCGDMCYEQISIFDIYDDKAFTHDLISCDTETINILCNLRISNIKFAWRYNCHLKEVDYEILEASMLMGWDDIFRLMLSNVKSYSYLFEIIFDEETLNSIN